MAALMERFCGMSDVEMLGIIESEWGYRLPRITRHASPKLVDAYCERALVAFADIHQSLDGIDFANMRRPLL